MLLMADFCAGKSRFLALESDISATFRSTELSTSRSDFSDALKSTFTKMVLLARRAKTFAVFPFLRAIVSGRTVVFHLYLQALLCNLEKRENRASSHHPLSMLIFL
jgi:hypothetical protein